jgi:hypothetical protein
VVVVTARFSGLLLAILLLVEGASAAQMQTDATQFAQAQSVRELRASLESAKRQAAESEGLDAAYELVGIAEAAQNGGAQDLTSETVGLLNSVLDRATQSALSASIEDAQDTLDQLVDLSFFARTSKVTGADAVLQRSLRTLFPKIVNDVRAALGLGNNRFESWQKTLSDLGVLGELQASALLMMLDDVAAQIGAAYDVEAARLESLMQQMSNDEQRTRAAADLTERRKIREEQLADAKANNLATVAAEMSKPGRARPEDEDSAEAADAYGEIAMTCVETGVIAPDGMTSNWDGLLEIVTKLEEECVLSGRVPTESRCPGRDLSFICREPLDEKTEQLTYVYKGTREETSMREACKGERVGSSAVAASGASFKNTAMRRILSCAPVPEGRGQD